MKHLKTLILGLACLSAAAPSAMAQAGVVCSGVKSVQLYQGEIPGEKAYYEVIPDVDNGVDAAGNVTLGWNYFNANRGLVIVMCDGVQKTSLPLTTSKCGLQNKVLRCQ